MPLTLYSWNDVGAPGSNPTLIQVLDACLVNGYGSKAPAGWTKEFTDTNKAVYRMPATAPRRLYLRVAWQSGGYAFVHGYLTMTNVDTGTNRFPNTDTSWWLWNAFGGTGNHWMVLADDRTVLFVPRSAGTGLPWSPYYFGYLSHEVPGDSNHAVCLSAPSSGIPTASGGFSASSYPSDTAYPCALLGTYPDLTNGVIMAAPFTPSRAASVQDLAQGTDMPPFPSYTGGYQLERIKIQEIGTYAGGVPKVYRGTLRGLLWPCHNKDSIPNLGSITGTGPFSGLTLLTLKPCIGLRFNASAPYTNFDSAFGLVLAIGD